MAGVLGTPGALGALLIIGLLAGRSAAAERVPVTCPVVADTTVFSAQVQEGEYNWGGSKHLRTRGHHSFVLLRFDLTPAQGLQVTQATLRLRRVTDLATRVGVSTVAAGADWTEGTSTEPEAVEGTVCYTYAGYHSDRREARYWARPGSDFSDVVFGNGGSRWVPRVARFDKESRWYEIDIPAEFVQAMMRGLQPGGLCLSDDFGRDETAPTFWSRESNDPPVLIVSGQPVASTVSEPPTAVRATRDGLGRDWVAFAAPRALGFEVYLAADRLGAETDLGRAVKLETWALPAPGSEARRALLSLHRESTHQYVGVRVVEAGGQWSPLVWAALPPPVAESPVFEAPALPRFDLPTVFDSPFTLDDGPALSEDGRWMRSAAQTWWNPRRGPITLEAGRNEFLSLQVVLAGGPGTYAVALADWTSPGAAQPAPRVQFYRQHYVKSRLGREKYAPDGLLPLKPSEPLRLELAAPAEAAQPRTQPARRRVVQGVWVDIYVPHRAARGPWRTRVIVLRDGRALLDVPLELKVVDLTLPDRLGFQVSLDSARAVGSSFGVEADSPRAWELLGDCYRMAHQHRVTLAILPYGADGKARPGLAPVIELDDGRARLDWDEWDRRFGPYLDGSAFRDLPREAVPLGHFYLPFHENWPLRFAYRRAPARSHLSGKYHHRSTWTERRPGQRTSPHPGSYMVWPIEDAFSAQYKEGTATVLRQAAEHLVRRGWTRTEFQLYLRHTFAARGAGSWWQLRNPQVHDDFLALRFWLEMYRDALAEGGPFPIRLRADLELPQFQRDTLDRLVDVAAVGEMYFLKNRLVLSHPERYPRRWFACRSLAPESGWSEVWRWGWAARLAGAGGMVCQDGLGRDASWDQADDGALLYPAARFGHDGPYPSLRLKALRRVQQDLEWVAQWVARVQANGIPEGYALTILGGTLVTRSDGRVPYQVALLPVVEFPGRLDTVAFEEIRRGLRRMLRE